MRKLAIGALALGCVAAMTVPALAGDTPRASTQVTVYGAGAPDSRSKPRPRLTSGFRVYGKTSSSRPKCAKLRRIDLYESRPGRDPKLGSGYTDTLRYWSIHVLSSRIETGEVYAKAPRTRRGGVVCSAGRSANFSVIG